MAGEIRNIIKVACVYMATIIGAGFASGQEIVQFFSSYYEGGFYGIILAGILFAVIGYVVLSKVYTERIRSYDEFLFPTVGWFFGWIMNIASTLFMLSVFCIMIAGAGNVFMNKLGIPYSSGVVLMAIICMIALLCDIKGITALSSVITPVMIAGILGVGIFVLICKDTSVFKMDWYITNLRYNWFSSSLIYVGYNSIIAIAIMCSLLPNLRTRKVAVIGGISGGLVLCLIALIINTAVMIFAPGVLSNELPVLSIAQKYGNALSNIYALILWLAMFISAVTSGYCFTDRLSSKINIDRRLVTVVVCALVIPLSGIGFSNLISGIYPIFGYIGLFLVFATLIQGAKIKPRMAVKK